jgi:multicomponent Na+:H+ antiporter subunit E
MSGSDRPGATEDLGVPQASARAESPPVPPSPGPSQRRTPATTMLAWNLVLAIAWVAMSGTFTIANLALGFALGYGVLFAARRAVGGSSYFSKTWRSVAFVAFYLSELVRANLRVAYDVLTPTHHMQPGIIAVPLEARNEAEITLLANLITMTPGTLSMDVSDDRSVLYVHGMFVEDPAAFAASIKNDFERRVIELLR